jgi:hypothetical protein
VKVLSSLYWCPSSVSQFSYSETLHRNTEVSWLLITVPGILKAVAYFTDISNSAQIRILYRVLKEAHACRNILVDMMPFIKLCL